MDAAKGSIRWPVALILVILVVEQLAGRANPVAPQDANASKSPLITTAQQDHQRLLDLLHIKSLRKGADGTNAQAPNAANYDESKANPYPNLPDPLILNSGRKVITPKLWWSRRR